MRETTETDVHPGCSSRSFFTCFLFVVIMVALSAARTALPGVPLVGLAVVTLLPYAAFISVLAARERRKYRTHVRSQGVKALVVDAGVVVCCFLIPLAIYLGDQGPA